MEICFCNSANKPANGYHVGNWISITMVQNVCQKRRLKNFKLFVMTICTKAVLGNQSKKSFPKDNKRTDS